MISFEFKIIITKIVIMLKFPFLGHLTHFRSGLFVKKSNYKLPISLLNCEEKIYIYPHNRLITKCKEKKEKYMKKSVRIFFSSYLPCVRFNRTSFETNNKTAHQSSGKIMHKRVRSWKKTERNSEKINKNERGKKISIVLLNLFVVVYRLLYKKNALRYTKFFFFPSQHQ